MRVLYLNHNLRGRGTYFRAFEMAREMARRGHAATLLTAAPNHWYRPAEETVDGVRIVETPSWNPFVNPDDGWGPLDFCYRMWRTLAEKCDLVYAFAHPPTVFYPARLAQILRRKPLVADWCDAYRDGIFPLREEIRKHLGDKGGGPGLQRWAEAAEKRLERRILRKANAVTVISKELARAALAEGVREENLLHIPSGANLEAFQPSDKRACRETLRRENAEALKKAKGADGRDVFEGEGPFLAYIANYNPDERLFLSALARVFERFPGARLLTMAPPFAPAVVERAGVADRLVQLGRQPFERLNALLGAVDALLLPLDDNASNRYRWPNKFGDYLAAGRPVATSAIGDIANYFPAADRMREWLSAPGEARWESGAPPDSPLPIGVASRPDADSFAEGICCILEHPEKWDAMGWAARRTAETRLDWKQLAGELEVFLEKTVQGHGRRRK